MMETIRLCDICGNSGTESEIYRYFVEGPCLHQEGIPINYRDREVLDLHAECYADIKERLGSDWESFRSYLRKRRIGALNTASKIHDILKEGE